MDFPKFRSNHRILMTRWPLIFSGCIAVGLWLTACRESSLFNWISPEREPHEEYVADLDLDKIKNRGYLTAIMQNSSTGLFIYRGRTMGYEYELLRLFAEHLDLELRIDVTPNLEEAFAKLNRGEGDLLAYNLTVTKERQKRIAFSHYHHLVPQVLVQRKPDNWRELKAHEIEKSMIRNPVDLIGREVHVRYQSAHLERLQNLSNEIGGDIIIVQEDPDVETETIIQRVAEGLYDYTVAEENVALVNSTYYPNLDVSTAISFPTQIAWGLRKNADTLLTALNDWILKMRKTTDYYVIYDKYFRSSRSSLRRSTSEYSSLGGGKLSPFDEPIKSAARDLEWDWRLLAAQIYRESKFDPEVESWAGAVGLMQVLPGTALEKGIEDLRNPEENIRAGTSHLKWLMNYFENVIENPEERLKFVLAAYNVGHGHVMDAIKLTQKYGGDPQVWDGHVSDFLIKKSEEAFFSDPVVTHGYCRGREPVQYVQSVFSIYQTYLAMIPADEPI